MTGKVVFPKGRCGHFGNERSRAALLGAKPMEGFFMSKEPKQKGRVTYHGPVPETDPRYRSGWNFLSGKNLRPEPPEAERVVLAEDEEKHK
jgi:hypothetical protein